MTIAEAKTALKQNSFPNEDIRAKALTRLLQLMCPTSKSSIRRFQQQWDRNETYEQFVIQQNKCFLDCLQLEQSTIGEAVRTAQGMKPTLEDDLVLIEQN